ncbi:hypothetical protein Mapa_005619 [Marchantia paleacea]|nr:hypothetical protein Mapa_005619 [Marchantia paleacea]
MAKIVTLVDLMIFYGYQMQATSAVGRISETYKTDQVMVLEQSNTPEHSRSALCSNSFG